MSKTKFCFNRIVWNSKRNEINFVGAFVRSGPRSFEVVGVKQVVFKNEKLYLCLVDQNNGKKSYEVFKILNLSDDNLKNFREDKVQYMGKNERGRFVLDAEFQEGMKMVHPTSVETIKLSELRQHAREESL